MKRIYRKYRQMGLERTILSTITSLFANLLNVGSNLWFGIYLGSVWFISNAVYYLVLIITRGESLRKYVKSKKIQDITERKEMEFCVYRHNGYLLCLLSIAYWGICMGMFIHGDSTVYKGYAAFLIAAISFFNLGSAIYGVVATKKIKSPIISSLKVISYADALPSIVITESTLLTMKETANAAKNSAVTGMIFSVFILAAGIAKVIKKNRNA